MQRMLWPLALVVTFGLGWIANDALRVPSGGSEPDPLKEQVTRLQARLQGRDESAAVRPSRTMSAGASSPSARADTERSVIAAIRQERMAAEGRTQTAADVESRRGSAGDRASSRGQSFGTASPASVEAALDRFRRYLEATNAPEGGRERWQKARELVDELRGMGDAAGQALMHVLATGNDSEERRAAARLLGTLQVPESLPLLRQILERDEDVLMRRAAASGLRQLQTPESIPVMEHMLSNLGEDRMVRLSAAVGLAESGRTVGVNGLAQIFNESSADGRGRELAFRALTSLNDDRPLPFMRQLVTSDAEPAYRLRAIRYLTAQGDSQALASLQVVMRSPNEQPSIRDAAVQAYRSLGGK
jgi:hypothetical protein